ncbi:MAG: threonine--tRNA ligase [Nanoarchaeota archaeon]
MSDIETLRHSASHILAAAVKKLYPNVKLGIGPAVADGFYYDFGKKEPFTPEDLARIEKSLQHIVKQNVKFEKIDVDFAEAKKMLKDEPYKLELLEELKSKGEKITFYKSGDFIDMCRGPHVASAGKIGALKLTKISSAYWKGDEKKDSMQRIYGVAFESREELDVHVKMIEEAEKRDHRKLGRELDLFHIDDMVGLGLPLWHPKGAMLWRVIEDFWYKQHIASGYSLVRTPHIGNKVLWETSGHWGFYNESMYSPLEVGQTLKENQEKKSASASEQYLLKPMNCPFHIQIYKNRPHSYRELPLRWAECGTVYRFEKKGELSGLTRVRGFTQDDAHIICAANQVEDELKRVVEFILFIFKSFGFDISKINVYLSVRDPAGTKYAGTGDGWKFTEGVLEKVAKEKGLNYKKDIGGAVFYGPKLDFKIKDALNREWQCSTLQFDFNLPERFEMTFVNNQGKDERPYMLHRALFGSYERFIGLLIEHYAGKFPLWLSPVQVKVLTVNDRNADFAREIVSKLNSEGLRVELDDASETIAKKVRNAQLEKVNYILTIGDKEQEAKTLAVRTREGKVEFSVAVDKFVSDLKKEIEERK